ncbi:MAG: histidine--tRNA ligase [Candidatus Saccharimonas sp.]
MKRSVTTPRVPSGFNEYLPEQQVEFNRLLAIVRDVYERYGFTPLDTPTMELSEVLLTKSGGETEQQIYRFTKGKNDLCLRFDLTVPLARYVAQHEGALVFPFRRYQIGKVFRAERAQAGRFREFYQCDIDVVGSNSTTIDAELPAVINDIFERFTIGDFTIRINNRMILMGLFEELGIRDQKTQVLRIIDKLGKLSASEIDEQLVGAGLGADAISRLRDFLELTGTNEQILDSLEALDIKNHMFEQGVEKLRSVVYNLHLLGVPEKRFAVDLTIARGLDYYTGTVYETTLNDHPSIGSVCSGGRYDDLASFYTNTKLPGIGISIGLTRLFYKLCEQGIITVSKQPLANVIVLPMGDAELGAAFEVANALRAKEVPVITYTEPNVLAKKLSYVNKMGARYAIIIGEQEVKAGTVAVKDMETGVTEQKTTAQVLDLF